MGDTNCAISNDERNRRHFHWTLVAVASAISLIATLNDINGNRIDVSVASEKVKWVVASTGFTLVSSLIAVVAHSVMLSTFVGTWLEGIMTALVFLFWVVTLPMIMDSDNMLALQDGVILDANLYFFSWCGLIASYLVLTGFLKEKKVGGSHMVSAWGALCLLSFLVMMAAIRDLDHNECCNIENENDFIKNNEYGVYSDFQSLCKRTKFAIAVGGISSVVAALWMILARFIPQSRIKMIEVASSVFVLIFWTFGVALLTFGGQKAPASYIGNLYFFTWGSFLISCVATMTAIQQFRNSISSDEVPGDQVAHKSRETEEGNVDEENVEDSA